MSRTHRLVLAVALTDTTYTPDDPRAVEVRERLTALRLARWRDGP